MREFSIESLPGITFREANVSPVDLLAIASQVDFDEFGKTKQMIQFSDRKSVV